MSYLADIGEVSAVFRTAADVERVTFPTSGTVARFVAPGSVTRGQYGLFEWNMQPRSGGSDPHFHKTFSEAFYVMSGVMQLYNGETWRPAHAGEYLYVPEGGIHGFRGADHARMLLMFTPGAPREDYFETLHALGHGATMTDDERVAFMLQHDTHWI